MSSDASCAEQKRTTEQAVAHAGDHSGSSNGAEKEAHARSMQQCYLKRECDTNKCR
jgi:hypothetical protein